MPLTAVFVQIVQGRAADADALREHHHRWIEELAPGADGWLGSTAGISDDGEYILLARFASAEAVRRSSQRGEQDDWWRGLEDLVEGEMTVHDCRNVAEIARGGSDDAGFVQVFQGRAPQIDEVLDRIAEREEATLPHRPSLIGGYLAVHSDGPGFSEVLYYPSEAEAEGSQAEEVREKELTRVAEIGGAVSELRRLDLRDPWLHSA